MLRTVRLLRSYPDIRTAYQEKWPHILVDEYQDTNPIQADTRRREQRSQRSSPTLAGTACRCWRHQRPLTSAFEALAEQALRATASASAGRTDWVEAVGAGVRGLLEFIAANRLFARLVFFELPTAGTHALDRAEATTRRFTANAYRL